MNGNSPVIRRAARDDVPALTELGVRTFQETYGGLCDPGELANHVATHFTLERLAAEMDDPASLFFLAFLEGRPVGYAKLGDTVTPSCVTGTKPIELSRIYLEQAAIGKGVGAALMKICLDEAYHRGCDTIWLGVWDQNLRARAFYQAWGFQDAGTQEFNFGGTLYHDPVMVRPVGDRA
jgi:GNAT superfamily N-acetyltransferase